MLALVLIHLAVVANSAKSLQDEDWGPKEINVIDQDVHKAANAFLDAKAEMDTDYSGDDKVQQIERELKELQYFIHGKEKKMEAEIANLKSAVERQECKMAIMEKDINYLRVTVDSQSETISVLRREIAEKEIKLNTSVYQHGQIIKAIDYKIKDLGDVITEQNKMLNGAKFIGDFELKRNVQFQTVVKHEDNAMNDVTKHEKTIGLGKAVKLRKFANAHTNVAKNISNFSPSNRRWKRTPNIPQNDPVIERNIRSKSHERAKQSKHARPKMLRQTMSEGGIAFSAYLGHRIDHLAPGHTVKCDQVLLNDGDAYNSLTGVFTVPQTGVYLLTFNIDVYDHRRYEGVQLIVNSRKIVDAIAEGNDNKYAMSGNTAIIQLTQGESVWLESFYSGDGELISSSTYRLTTFSGVFLY